MRGLRGGRKTVGEGIRKDKKDESVLLDLQRKYT
jgi:hypothetical protein